MWAWVFVVCPILLYSIHTNMTLHQIWIYCVSLLDSTYMYIIILELCALCELFIAIFYILYYTTYYIILYIKFFKYCIFDIIYYIWTWYPLIAGSASPVTLKFLGRELHLQKVCNTVLDTTFSELCERVRHSTGQGKLLMCMWTG